MKNEQQQKARKMYFQSDFSKTEIAEKLNVSRRSVFQWSVDGDWEKLKTSARNMPSILAEKCYYLIGHFTDHLLSRESSRQSVTKTDADILHKLAKTVMLLKKGSTINENMETFTWFLEGLQKRDAKLAEAVAPYAETFINARAATDPSSFTLSGHDAQGHKSFNEKETMEKWLDEQDAAAILNEMKNTAPAAVETGCIPSLHSTGTPVETEDFPSPNTTRTENNEQNTPEQDKEYDVRKAYEEYLRDQLTPKPPRTFSPSVLATIAKAEKTKARQARYEEEKARKEARKFGKAA